MNYEFEGSVMATFFHLPVTLGRPQSKMEEVIFRTTPLVDVCGLTERRGH